MLYTKWILYDGIKLWKTNLRLYKFNFSRGGDDKYLINIGSNIWRWSIWLAKKYNYNVIAFEPVPLIYHQLRTNVVLSDLEDKITTYNIWLWNKNSKMHMEYKRWRCWNSHIVEDNYEEVEWWDIVTVNVKKFDDLWIDDSIIKKTKLIIMDVEWFEFNVINWMSETLSKLKNISIIMEIHENPKKNDTIKFMEDLWYKSSIVFDWNYLFKK